MVDSTTVNHDYNSDDPESWSVTTSTLNSGGYVLISLAQGSGTTPSSVTFDGATMTFIGGTNNTTDSNIQVKMWGLAVGAKAGGTYTAAVNGLGGRQLDLKLTTWNGVNQTTPYVAGGLGFAQGSSTSPSVTIVSSSSERVVDVIAYDVTTTATGANTEYFDDNSGDANVDGAGQYATGSASTPMGWTLGTSSLWCQMGVSLIGQ